MISQARTNPASPFICLSVAYGASILLPILLADRPCNDDLIRSVIGSYGWFNNGRYLANFLMRVLELDAPRTTDLSPLPQVLAILVLSYAGVLLARRFSVKPVLAAALVGLPLGAQPFFLENLAYRFDAITMAAAVLGSVAACASPSMRWKSWVIGLVALLATLNLYQPAFNVFLVFAVLEICVPTSTNGDRPFARAGFRVSQAIVAALLYHVFFTTGIKEWIADHGQTIQSLGELPVVFRNLQAFCAYVVATLGHRIAVLMGVLLVVAVVASMLGASLRLCQLPLASKRWLVVRFALLLCWPLLTLVAAFGPMLLLREPIFAPRILIGVGAVISSSLIALFDVSRANRRFSAAAPAVASVWLMLFAIVAGAYSSAAREQTIFEERIASRMIDDIVELEVSNGVERYAITGSAGYAPAVQHTAEQFPIVLQIISPYLFEDSFYTRAYLMHFTAPFAPQPPALLSDYERAVVLDPCLGHVARVRSNNKVRVVDKLAIVDFRGNGTTCGNR